MNIKDRYDSLWKYYGEFYGVDWKLLKAQAMAESQMDPDAVSRVGAKGLCQFMPATFAEYASMVSPDPLPADQSSPHIPNAYNPEDAIRAQARYMKKLIALFGNADKACAAYNCGPGMLSRVMARAKEDSNGDWLFYCPKETQGYVDRISGILSKYNEIKNLTT